MNGCYHAGVTQNKKDMLCNISNVDMTLENMHIYCTQIDFSYM